MNSRLRMAALLGALAGLLLIRSAKADATLTCALTGAGAANASSTLVISDADGGRVLAYARSRLPLTPPPTNAQAVKAALDDLLASIRTGVIDFERNSAVIPPVTPK